MKKFLLISFLLISTTLQAQFDPLLQPNEGLIGGGLGVVWINGQPNYAMQFTPEIAFANVGVGINLRLEFDSKGNVRSENFNEFSDYLSIIRYVRYGHKGDDFYGRVGALDYATLGHGSIMYLYNNSPSFDSRRIGLEFDLDLGEYGIETVWGNFAQSGVAGFRGHVKPMQFTSLAKTPVLGNLEVGFSLASDFDKKAGVAAGNYDAVTNKFTSTVDEGSITIVGLDLGLPIVQSKTFDLQLYLDYAKIIDFGSGAATGIMMGFKGLGLVDVYARFERRFNGENYIPSYFNSLYEIERFNLNKSDGQVTSKVQQLKTIGDVGDGYFGSLLVKVLNTFRIIGSYQRLDDQPNSGRLYLSTEIAPESMPYMARAGYEKINIKDEGDMFNLDDRSYMFAELGYKPMPYVLVSIVYHWTYEPIRDADENIIEFKPQKRIEPRVSFIYPINIGGQ